MLNKLQLMVVVFLSTAILSACGLFDVKQQQQQMAVYCHLYGSVKPEVDSGKKLVVVLFKVDGNDKSSFQWQLFDHFVLDRPGKWYFATTPGNYLLAAFKDVNKDMIYQLDEPALAPVPANMVSCGQGETKSGFDLVIAEQGRTNAKAPMDIAKLQVRSTKQQLDVSLGQVTQIGAVTTLDEPRFADQVAEQSLWRPFDFLVDGFGGLYFLEPYNADKIPVLFVHGINGTPRNFKYLIEQLDRDRFQPWLVYYPSGSYIDSIARNIDQMQQKLQAKYHFNKMVVVAHSMGGLVSRRYLLNHSENSESLTIPLFVSISTPWDGHAAAKLGVEHAPAVVYAWEDLAPGSRFLGDLFYADDQSKTRRRLPNEMEHHLLFSFIDSESGDGTVSLSSELRPEAQEEAYRLYGYQHSHMGILNAPETTSLVNQLLKGVR